ncbi:hypothetical protein J5N97_001297 [Dioscorea zingiberensis]|uniref:Bromo domain-containing protein n=1 Tax=Dioscorea zingiberensis TaxID=325984 RepID=A0A9D5H2G6_9LILI|nr:hypothetical protein J5N97_001297 [Dioscorea zingiberensis]
MSSDDEDDAMEASARLPDGEPASAEAHGAELGDEEALLRSLGGIVSRVDRMERRVDELDRFFASKKSLGGSGRKPASKGKGRKVGIKFRDAEVDSEFMDVGVNDGAPSKRMQEIMRRFGEIFRQILKHQWAGPFMDPVDVEGLQLHDYYKIIKKPMDFNTIKNRMEEKNGSGYKNVREIYADVRLVFTNAMTYNGEKNEYHVMAKALLGRLEDKWLDLLPMVLEEERRQEEAQTQAKINRQIAQEAVMMKMAKDTNDEKSQKDNSPKGLCHALSLEDIFKAIEEIVAKKDS